MFLNDIRRLRGHELLLCGHVLRIEGLGLLVGHRARCLVHHRRLAIIDTRRLRCRIQVEHILVLIFEGTHLADLRHVEVRRLLLLLLDVRVLLHVELWINRDVLLLSHELRVRQGISLHLLADKIFLNRVTAEVLSLLLGQVFDEAGLLGGQA